MVEIYKDFQVLHEEWLLWKYWRTAQTDPPTLVPLHERDDIECKADHINIFLPDNILTNRQNITWRDEGCSLTYNGTHYIGSVALTSCGTTVRIENATVTFENELIVHKVTPPIVNGSSNADTRATSDSDITYGSDYETVIPVQCVYPRFGNLSTSFTPIKQKSRIFEKRYGQLEVAMQQYDSDDYNTAFAADGTPRKVALNDDIFIRIGMDFEPSDIKVKADRCIATSSPAPADSNWRQLIQDGCPVNDVRLLSKENAHDVRFTLKAFDFRHNSSGFVFIHCQVAVCNSNDAACSMGCASRAKRSAAGYGSRADSHLVSTGPLFVERPQEASKNAITVTVPAVLAAGCLMFGLVATVFAFVVWIRKPRQQAVSS